jgi:hypothetical protein
MVWKRFWRLSQTVTFEAFFLALTACSQKFGAGTAPIYASSSAAC